jgi:hypothetical protein
MRFNHSEHLPERLRKYINCVLCEDEANVADELCFKNFKTCSDLI